MAKSKKKPPNRLKSAFFLLLLLIVILPLLAGLISKDYRGVSYGWFITIFWLAASFFAFCFSLIYFAQFVLPHQEGKSWNDGITMLLRSIVQFLPWRPQWYLPSDFPGHEHLPSSFNSLRAGLLHSHQAVAINKGTSYARADGPGFVSLSSGEYVGQVLDLRLHFRKQDVDAITRDGIPLTLALRTTFRIKPASPDPDEGNRMYSYDKTAVFQISQANSVDENNEYLPWAEQIVPQAASYLVSEVAQFSLNRLSEEPRLLVGIQDRVKLMLERNFAALGIKINSVTVFMIDFPDEIVEQRLANWKAPWEIKSELLDAERDAETLRRLKHARAEAQVEIIDSIMKRIQRMRRGQNISLPQVVNLRVIEALDEAIATSPWQTHFPGRVLADMALETSHQIQPLTPPLESEQEEGDEN